MNMLIDIVGLALIAFIVWWFWLYRPAPPAAVVRADAPVDILVADGVYAPAEIRVPVGRPVEITVAPASPGRYEFACQMRMYRGVLVVTEDTR